MTPPLKLRRHGPPVVNLRRQRLFRLLILLNLAESPAQPLEKKPETSAQLWVDNEEVYSEKMDVYIDCFNKLQLPVQHSLARYADWVEDFKKDPTGKGNLVYGIYGMESYITSCQKEMRQVAILTLLPEPTDGVAVSYIDRAG